MNRKLSIIIFPALAVTMACNSISKPEKAAPIDTTKRDTAAINPRADDSIKLTMLIRDVYKWVQTPMKNESFLAVKAKPTDTLLTQMDMVSNARALHELQSTEFFDNEFLINYRNLALRMDKELREGSSEWRDGDMPSFFADVNSWCNCQDYPDNYWEKLTITDLNIANNKATFNWTWGDNFKYRVRATREFHGWKISWLEGWAPEAFSWEQVKKYKNK